MKIETITDPDGVSISLTSEETNPTTSQTTLDIVQAEFIKRGFNVSKEALCHNCRAWCRDFKSGFRDDAGGYHLFSPCGCNPLRFDATRLIDGADWQKTYIS